MSERRVLGQRGAWLLKSWEGRQSSSERVLLVILSKLDLILKAMGNPLESFCKQVGWRAVAEVLRAAF